MEERYKCIAIEKRNTIPMGMESTIYSLMEYNEESDTYDYAWDCSTSEILNPYGPEDSSW